MDETTREVRGKLSTLLTKWRSGELKAGEVHREAEAILAAYEWDDVPKSDPKSIVNEVVSQLDVLNQQLIVVADIPAIETFLGTDPGDEQEAWRQWEVYWAGIDYTERQELLKGNPDYAV